MPNDEFRYATAAHFDYVVANGDTLPLFAIELDDASHQRSDRATRDQLKNRICSRFRFPLLRLGSRVLARRASRDMIIGWLVDVWFTFEAFRAGGLPDDEPFIPFSVLTLDESGRSIAPLALDGAARDQLHRLHQRGVLRHGGTQRRLRYLNGGGAEIYAIVALTQDRWVTGHARIDRMEWHGADVDLVLLQLLLTDALAIRDAAERVETFLTRRKPYAESLAMGADRYAAFRQRTADWDVFGLVGRGRWQSLVRLPAPIDAAAEHTAERLRGIAQVMALRDAIEESSGGAFPWTFEDVPD
jgi:hypothetical protein